MKDWFAWVKDDALRATADYTLNGGELDEEDARRALNLLRDESVERIKGAVGKQYYEKYYPTNRKGGNWGRGAPVGLVDHYTAGVSARGTLRWFSSKPRGPGVGNSSAHVVLDRDGSVFIVVDPLKSVAWHATWSNKNHIGIEHVNAGLLLSKTDGGIYYLGKLRYPRNRIAQLQEIDGKLWEPYTTPQLVSNLVFKRWLIEAIPTMQADRFVEHADIDPVRKIDCGPLWPLASLNDLVFSRKRVRGMAWLQKDFLTVEDVAAFKEEVAAYLSIKTPAV